MAMQGCKARLYAQGCRPPGLCWERALPAGCVRRRGVAEAAVDAEAAGLPGGKQCMSVSADKEHPMIEGGE